MSWSKGAIDEAVKRLDEEMKCPKCGSKNHQAEKEYHKHAVSNITVCNECGQRY